LIVAAGRHCGFIRDERAGATVEFVAVMPVFLLTAIFAMEVAIAILWVGTAEKAAQLGARLAVVSTRVVAATTCPTVTGLPTTNCLAPGFVYGQQCNIGACVPFCTATANCTCTNCGTAEFTTIVTRMRGILSQIQAQNVSISYTYVGLGYAGGPVVPSVTVTISGVQMGGIMTAIFAKFVTGLTTLPPVSVTLTGEDLSSLGAS
jgi:Flp pilus assembly protein TadG